MILITGGSGYLGGRIAQYLLATQNMPVAIGVRKTDLAIPDVLIGCRLLKLNLLDEDSLQIACKGVKVIIHLAGMDATRCARNPEDALMINGLGTMKLLRAADKQNVQKMIYFSTIHVYGSPLEGEISEQTCPKPLHQYSITKRLGEDFTLEAAARGKISTCIVRLSNAVGAPMTNCNCWDLVTNDLALQAVKNKCMVLQSDGSQKRDFISISDVAKVVLNLVELPRNVINGEIYNLGSGLTKTIIEVADLVSSRCHEKFNYRPKIIIRTKNSNRQSTDDFNFNVNKIKNIGIQVSKSITKEIDMLLQYCHKNMGNIKK